MKLVYYLQWENEAIAALAPQFPEIDFVKAASAADAERELGDADILIVAGPYYPDVAAAVNAAAAKLRWIQTSSVGTDRFEQGGVPGRVRFTNAAGLKGRTVAEHAMALLLGRVHAVPQMERARAAGDWARVELRKVISSIEDDTLLLLGYGSIGREIARKAKAFDARVIALNRSGEGGGGADVVAPLRDLADWLPKADYVVCSLPSTPETDRLIGDAEFRLMKPQAILINVGRGAVVDHPALIRALKQKKIAGACLDVFAPEPLPPEDAFWLLENVILSPHVAGTGGPLGRRFAALVADNLKRFRDGDALLNEVSIYRPPDRPR